MPETKSKATEEKPEDKSEQPAPQSQTAQATAAVSGAVSVVRERLVAGEQIALSAAALIAAVWIIWDLILDTHTVSSFVLLVAVLLILTIWVHRWGHYDFGKGYRIVLGALGVSLALFAVTDLLLTFRTDINASASQWLGNLLFWIGGIAALYGGWLVFRTR